MARRPPRDGLRLPPLRPRPMGPFEELEFVDLCVEMAALDEEMTCFDPDTHPKPPDGREEGVTSRDGGRIVDIMSDTKPIETQLNLR